MSRIYDPTFGTPRTKGWYHATKCGRAGGQGCPGARRSGDPLACFWDSRSTRKLPPEDPTDGWGGRGLMGASDGLDLHELVPIAQHGHAEEGAGSLVVFEVAVDNLPGRDLILPLGGRHVHRCLHDVGQLRPGRGRRLAITCSAWLAVSGCDDGTLLVEGAGTGGEHPTRRSLGHGGIGVGSTLAQLTYPDKPDMRIGRHSAKPSRSCAPGPMSQPGGPRGGPRPAPRRRDVPLSRCLWTGARSLSSCTSRDGRSSSSARRYSSLVHRPVTRMPRWVRLDGKAPRRIPPERQEALRL